MKWLILAFFLGCSSSPLDSKIQAEKAATTWFSNLDKGFFEKVFLESSQHLRDRLNKGKMQEMLTNRLLILGKNKSRTKKEEVVLEKYRGLGRGEFINLDYISDFEQRTSVTERLVLKKDGKNWRVFDYFFF
jgi:Protein of unknown function (DUF4019)